MAQLSCREYSLQSTCGENQRCRRHQIPWKTLPGLSQWEQRNIPFLVHLLRPLLFRLSRSFELGDPFLLRALQRFFNPLGLELSARRAVGESRWSLRAVKEEP